MHSIKVKVKRKGLNSEKYLNDLQNSFTYDRLNEIAKESLNDFKNSSPNAEIASNWSYNITYIGKRLLLSFENSTIENGENIAVLIDIGHGTVSGKWVPGTNYLKEPIKKTYERINKLLVEAQQ